MSLEIIDGATDLLGKHMSDFSDNLTYTIEGTTIKPAGELKKITGYTGFSTLQEEQSGYYLPFKVTPKNPEDAVSIQINEKPEVKATDDMIFIILLATESATLKDKTVKLKSGSETFTMDLSGLTAASE